MKKVKFYQQPIPRGWRVVCMYVQNGHVMAEIEIKKTA